MNNSKKFPGRVQRSKMIRELLHNEAHGDKIVLCGRVVGLIDGTEEPRAFILQDDSGRMEILTDDLPKVGTIIEVEVEKVTGDRYGAVGLVTVLADCEDFYISLKESPNYQRIIIDQELKDLLLKRSELIAFIRAYFVDKGFIDVETPCLVRLPGMEPYLDVFKTRFEAELSSEQRLSEDMYLITSPEYAMKKLLVGGLEKVFQVTKSFRNKETFSERHNPEFTILEWYRAYASYLDIMDDTENLVKQMWLKFGPRDNQGELESLRVKEGETDLMATWRRLKVLDAFKEYAGIDEEIFFDLAKFKTEVVKRGYAVSANAVFDDCFFTIFLNEIEPKLGFGVPVILYDYPVSMAALSKRCENDARFAERFEVYIGGIELCNAFTELNDPVEQEKRLLIEKEERKAFGKDLYDVDQTFIKALKFGMPPAGGNALGVDRLIMLILGQSDIRNIILFPHRDL